MKVEIYDLENKETKVNPTYKETAILEGELKQFADENWATNHKGWKSSFIPVADQFEITKDGKFVITAGYSRYAQQFGAIKARLDGMSFAPEAVNGLAVSTYVVTADDMVILPRRSAKVKHAPLVYNTPAGWMSSMNIDKPNCENPEFTKDFRLYDPLWQAVNEFREELKVQPSAASISIDPRTLVRGHDASFNWCLQYLARIDLPAKLIIKKMLGEQEEFAEGRLEHDKVAAVPVNQLEVLLRNQPELQKEDKRTFEPKDITELILLDDTIGVLCNEFGRLVEVSKYIDLMNHLGNGDIELVYRPTESGVYAPS